MSSIFAAPFVPTWSSHDHSPVIPSIVVKTETKERLLSIFRWATFLPAAYIGGVLAVVLWRLSFAMIGARSIPILDELAAMGVSGFAFMVAGAAVAPAGRKIVSVILLVIYTVMTGTVAFVGLGAVNGLQGAVGIAGLIAGVIGAGVGFFVAAEMAEPSREVL